MGFIILFILLAFVISGYINDHENRKECQSRAAAKGEKIYTDHHGVWWYGNRKCIEHWIGGRHVLTYLNDPSVIVKDFTAEEEVVKNIRIDAKKKHVRDKIAEAKANGKRYCSLSVGASNVECDVNTGEYYTIVREGTRFFKAYYNIIWGEWQDDIICTDVYEITRKEANEWSKSISERNPGASAGSYIRVKQRKGIA